MLNQSIKSILSVVLFALTSLTINAIPAKPGLMQFKNGDKVINVYLHGDENFHYYTTVDGYLLDYRDGRFSYAELTSDGRIAALKVDGRLIEAADPGDRPAEIASRLDAVDRNELLRRLDVVAAERTALRREMPSSRAVPPASVGLFPGCHFPSTGEQKAIVVLVEYQDVSFTTSEPLDYFTRLLNEPGFSDYDGTGSARDYFIENSSGKFQPQFDVYGPVKLSQKRAYYGGNNELGDDANAHAMVIEACEQLDGEVDFSEYDRDGDGFIDNIFVFFAGRGENSGGPAESVWPHAWNITKAVSAPLMFDGVRLDYYACSNEWMNNRPDGVGTFIHEFSHVMGLPDLYSTTGSSYAFTPGRWSVMDMGPYNNNSCTPPMYSAFERYALGWIEPHQITKAQNATLPPIGDNVAGIIATNSPYEFYLVENRQNVSWDSYVPGHGMLVWHVEYQESVWSGNRVNNNASHQCVDLVEADDIKNDETRDGDSFPGTAGVTEFTDETYPGMLTWAGKGLETPLTEIAEDGEEVTFKVMGGREPIAVPVAHNAADVEATCATAQWESTGAAGYRLEVYNKDEDGNQVNAVRYYLDDETELLLDGLTPETYYYYTVRARQELEMSAQSREIEFFTGHLTIDNLTVEACPVAEADVKKDGFTARWYGLEDATAYYINVYTKEPGNPYREVCAFDNGHILTGGWSTDATLSYSMSNRAGEAIPSLRMNQSQTVTSPDFEQPVKSLSFWHMGISTGADDCIKVDVKVNSEWVNVKTVPVVTDKGGVTTEITEVPDNSMAVRISFDRHAGNLALDDIVIMWGAQPTETPVEGYVDREVGNGTDYTVSGLKPDTYFFTVTATDGELKSRPSAEQEVVVTGQDAGIEVLPADMTTWSLDGLTLRVNATQGTVCRVVDVAGRTVAVAEGDAVVALPARGVYILNVQGEKPVKILAK